MNFERCLDFTLSWEGGFSSHPLDPGGKTCHGITQATYSNWLKRQSRPDRSVAVIEHYEVRAIYQSEYWDKVRGDLLPWPLCLSVFDYSVNSGTGRAIRTLQGCMLTVADGLFGNVTLYEVGNHAPRALALQIADRREQFLHVVTGIRGELLWPTFGKGWANRLTALRKEAAQP